MAIRDRRPVEPWGAHLARDMRARASAPSFRTPSRSLAPGGEGVRSRTQRFSCAVVVFSEPTYAVFRTERLQLATPACYREQKDLRPGIRDVRDGTLTKDSIRWAKTVVPAGMVTSSSVSFVSSREPWVYCASHYQLDESCPGSPRRCVSRANVNTVSRFPLPATPSNRDTTSTCHRSYANSPLPCEPVVNSRVGPISGSTVPSNREPSWFRRQTRLPASVAGFHVPRYLLKTSSRDCLERNGVACHLSVFRLRGHDASPRVWARQATMSGLNKEDDPGDRDGYSAWISET